MPPKPALDAVLARAGSLPLVRYAATLFDAVAPPSAVFVEVVAAETGRTLGPERAAAVLAQLARSPVVSTADHHGPLLHPVLFQTNLIAALGARAHGLEVLPVLACAVVPFDNGTFPRGVIWDGARLPLRPNRENARYVFGAAPFERPAWDALAGRLRAHALLALLEKQVPGLLDAGDTANARVKLGRLAEKLAAAASDGDSRSAVRRLAGIVVRADLRERYAAVLEDAVRAAFEASGALRRLFLDRAPAELFALAGFCEQVSVLNARLWDDVARHLEGFPALVYLPKEAITRELIRRSIGTGDPLDALLFSPAARSLAVELFGGIEGAWEVGARGGGTVFFWGMEPSGRPIALRLAAGSLVSPGLELELALEPSSIVRALGDGRLVPGLLLSFFAELLHGVQPLGGFNQIEYLARMHAGMRRFCRELGYAREAAMLETIDPSRYVCGPVAVSSPGDPRASASPCDFLRDPAGMARRLERESSTRTLAQAHQLGLDAWLPLSH